MKRIVRLGLIVLCASALAAASRGAETAGFSVAVLVDGAPAPEYCSRGRVFIEALKGREFTIRLSNPSPERVAVALSVDGRNVIDAKRSSALSATKWILMPGQTADIPGWQVSGQTARRFFFTETSSSYARWLGDTANVGTIEAVWFREKRREPTLLEKDSAAGATRQAPADEPKARGDAPAPKSAATTRSEAADAYAATGIGDSTSFPVRWVSFEENPVPAARIALRYEFRPELIRLGVVLRGDDLAARDRATGFEHDYAPDPYRHR